MPQDRPTAQQIVEALRELPSDTERAAYLDQACGANRELRDQVIQLLGVSGATDGTDITLDLPAGQPAAATASGSSSSLGERIGSYELLEELGEGGMGTVFLAQQREPVNRQVALKIIRQGMDSEQVVARFEAERQALALMDHPNIARVLDGGQTESGRPYFVMELVRGIPITQYCDKHRLSTRDRLRQFAAVCRAIQHAHQKGIIHRDIKPSNVLVTVYEGVPVPKVIDFGIAKAVDDRLTDGDLQTQVGQVVGTLEYMSPEQADGGAVDIDTRSDIYSLGVLLYELLTGATPITKEQLRQAGMQEMIRAICQLDPPKPSTRISDLGEEVTSVAQHRQTEPHKLSRLIRGDLDWIVMKALEKDRMRRYETANGLATDIERFLTDQPVSACPPSVGYQFRKFAARNKTLLAAGAAVAMILLASTAVSTYLAIWAMGAQQLANQRLADERESRRAEAQQSLEANRARAGMQAFGEFLVNRVLTTARPVGAGGLGVDVTVARAIEEAEKDIHTDLAENAAAEATARVAIGRTWYHLGKFAAAEPHLRRAHEIWSQGEGADELDQINAATLLAIVLGRLGKRQKAVEIYEGLLAKQIALRGRDDPGNGNIMRNLAVSYSDLGQYDKAIPLMEEGLRLHEELYGDDDLSATHPRVSLAMIYFNAGRREEAMELLESIVALAKEQLGMEHVDTDYALRTQALLYGRLEKHEQSVEVWKELLAIRVASLGATHTHTLETKNHLARQYLKIDQPQHAVPLFEAVFEHRTSDTRLGPIWRELVDAYLANGQEQDAREMLRREEQLRRDSLPAGSSDLGDALFFVAGSYLNMKDWDRAASLFRESLGILQEVQPEDWFTFNVQASLAEALIGQGDLEGAEALLRQGAAGMAARESDVSRNGRRRLKRTLSAIIAAHDAAQDAERVKYWQAELERWGFDSPAN